MPNIRALKSVREQRGLELEHVALAAAISRDRLSAFERGDREPSRKQMEKLANLYGVPLYSLFIEGIPNLPPLPLDFRKADPSPASLTPRGFRSILTSERIAHFALQVARELNYKPADFARDSKSIREPVPRAKELRTIFDEWLEPRVNAFGFSGSLETRFTGALRLFLEVTGNIVSVNDAPVDDFMGYFIRPEAGFQTIFVNRSVSSKKAQLFTLAHEYCHALVGAAGISNPFAARNLVERQCNKFAAEFLAPMDKFTRTVDSIPRAARSQVTSFVDAVAQRTLLSKHATAIRLVETNHISQQQFRAWRSIFIVNPKIEKDEEKEQSPGGGAPHAKRIGELGYLPVVLAKRALDAKYIDGLDVFSGLGLSFSLQERAFALASRRFEAALP